MLRTILVLPDGSELISGVGTKNAIKNITFTQCVNEGQELTVGSACSNMVEVNLIAPDGALSIAEGDEFTLYREDAQAVRHKIGLFTAQKPVRSGSHSLKVTAYDRVSWLDQDLTDWLAGLQDWPYSLHTLAQMTCRQCNLELRNEEIPNGPYKVRKFSAQGITGRTIMKWIGQIAGRFCRATADGLMEFAWYTPAHSGIGGGDPVVRYGDAGNVQILCPAVEAVCREGDGVLSGVEAAWDGRGDVALTLPDQYPRYYQGSLRYCDYQVEPVRKVQIKCSATDVGTVYPENVPQNVNTYILSGNYLLTAADAHTLREIAQSLYELLAQVQYTPCSVKIPAGFAIEAGNTVKILDRNGVTITAYVMTRKQSGQADTLECTGSPSRSGSAAVNQASYQALSGKVLELSATVDGLQLQNRDTQENFASLTLDVAGISSQVQRQQADVQGVQQQITQIRQDGQAIDLRVKTVEEQGVQKVTTETGFTFDKKGLTISRSGTQMENLLDETGMFVKRSGKMLLQADQEGVTAVDVSVGNYLVIGDHARFEDYDRSRTACFWI